MTQISLAAGMELVLRAAAFAADRHRLQRRKDADASPYVNHPLALAHLISSAGIVDPEILSAALLHDTVEDTDTTLEELRDGFGPAIAGIVAEVTDDKSLEKSERKRQQVDNAPHKSPQAKIVKLADKISNLRDILASPPAGWSAERKLEYFEWAARVVEGLRGTNQTLEAEFDRVHAQGISSFGEAA